MTNINKYYQYHHCDRKGNGIEIIFTDFNEESGNNEWWFHLYQEATEEDLENFVADQVGELISSKAIVIAFCPFCGKNLNDD